MYLPPLLAAGAAALAVALAPGASAAELGTTADTQRQHSWDQEGESGPGISDGSVHAGIHGRGVMPHERPDMTTSPRIGWLWGIDAETRINQVRIHAW